MSYLSGNTKKVSVYGRKAEVRIVNRHNDFNSFGNDENDPFGFFPSQSKPKSTYGRSRASILPSKLLADNAESDDEDKHASMSSQSASDHSALYATADSSASFHSAISSASDHLAAHGKSSTKSHSNVLSSKTPNTKAQKPAKTKRSPVKRVANIPRTTPDEDAISATPKARRGGSRHTTVASPQTIRKPSKIKPIDTSTASTSILPLESTPPSSLPTGRAPRRAAQAARMAIEDYDFADRDMTPRRPVPTKSYFAEKARQLAELAQEEKQEKQDKQNQMHDAKALAVSRPRNASRKSMVPRPRHTSALTKSASRIASISDSFMTSVITVSDSSFDAGGTSQSSFSLTGPSSDESFEPARKRSAAAAAKAKQNKRVTRRIVATSDDEEDEVGHSDEGSDDEVEQDPTVKLAAQIAGLSVAEVKDAEAQDSHLAELLASISQTKPENFSDVIRQLRSSTKGTNSRLRLEKIGEASYSEVFKIFTSTNAAASDKENGHEALVLKIIPIGNSMTSGGREGEDFPFCSPAADVEREIRLMQLIGREQSGSDAFVTLRSAHVVKGAYPAALLQAWDRWDAKRRAKTGEGAENIRPDVLNSRQAYALLVMTDGGIDLESLKVKSWFQAASIFWQVAAGLGEMESTYEFEHRDLHWGNILVQRVQEDGRVDGSYPSRRKSSARSSSSDDAASSWLLDSSVSGVKAIIIDFTLSRAAVTASKGRSKKADVLYYPFDDESLFEGSGDPQFDVYREMRLVTKGDWQTFTPSTNTLWLRYLARKIIDVKCKACRIPKTPAEADFEAQTEWKAYTLLHTAAQRLDRAVEGLLSSSTKKPATAGRKSLHPKARKSTFPSAAGSAGARKGRATSAVTPLSREEMEDDQAGIGSVAQLLTLLG